MDTMQSGQPEQQQTGGGQRPIGDTMQAAKSEARGMFAQLETLFDEYLVRKAPFQIPENIREFLVKVAPYVTIITAILLIPALLAVFGLSALLTPFAVMGGGMHWGTFWIVSWVLALIAFVLEVMAIPGLFKRTQGAWRLLFYASLVSFLGNIFYFNLGAVIGSIIGWYILFQIKALYRN